MAMTDSRIDLIEKTIRRIPDFPKPGILFRDITPLLTDPKVLSVTLDVLQEGLDGQDLDRIVAIEARGFLFGAALADRMGIGLGLVRKKGKLPWKTESVTYDLEYGTDTVEMHLDAVSQGHRVWIIDDLLATGGTAAAAVALVRKMGGAVVGASFVVELDGLGGRARLADMEIQSLLRERE
ncbi:MAG: adenine phosphoribosyltransferase [Deltaproteobacteria bacterium]|nr:adenine phosphoribosyltransferase [Deltaproteobacteria bacterium]